jgi:integrase
MGRDEIIGFLSHLAVHERLSASTQNQAFNALLFLYKAVLDRDVGQLSGVVRADRPRRLPVVLTHDEVGRLFAQLDGVVLLVCRLLYGSGLRLLESLHMRVKDVDFQRLEIVVRDGKGGKDTRDRAACRLQARAARSPRTSPPSPLGGSRPGAWARAPSRCACPQVRQCRQRMGMAIRLSGVFSPHRRAYRPPAPPPSA